MALNNNNFILDIPSGIPLNDQLEQKEKIKQLDIHIETIIHSFNKLLSKNSKVNRKGQTRDIDLKTYKVDKSVFGFSTNNYELREYANFLCKQFYKQCISDPISELKDQNLSQKGIDQTRLMKTIHSFTLGYGKREIVYQMLYIFFIILVIIGDVICIIENTFPQISYIRIQYFLYFRLCLLPILFVLELCYMIKAKKLFLYLSYLISALTTIFSILSLVGIQMGGDVSPFKLLIQIIPVGITIILCSALCIHLFYLEIGLQRIRVLLGEQYQLPFFCC